MQDREGPGAALSLRGLLCPVIMHQCEEPEVRARDDPVPLR